MLASSLDSPSLSHCFIEAGAITPSECLPHTAPAARAMVGSWDCLSLESRSSLSLGILGILGRARRLAIYSLSSLLAVSTLAERESGEARYTLSLVTPCCRHVGRAGERGGSLYTHSIVSRHWCLPRWQRRAVTESGSVTISFSHPDCLPCCEPGTMFVNGKRSINP